MSERVIEREIQWKNITNKVIERERYNGRERQREREKERC